MGTGMAEMMAKDVAGEITVLMRVGEEGVVVACGGSSV